MKFHHKKLIRGPGGIACDCCRVGSKKFTRVALNRVARRQNKIALACELTLSQDEENSTN